MPEPQRGIGRGLAAILSISEGGARDDAPELREVAVELICPNPAQPRKRFDEAGLTALADSLAERGLLQPVLVRPRPGGSYELVAGERRWRAAQLAGLETMPALVQQRDDEASLEVALVENMAREDLNPVEAARAGGAPRGGGGPRVGRARGGGGLDARGGRSRGGAQPCPHLDPASSPRPARRGAAARRA